MIPIDRDKVVDAIIAAAEALQSDVLAGDFDLGTCETCRNRYGIGIHEFCAILPVSPRCVLCDDIKYCGLWEAEDD
jgi:hypothetical protein